MVIPRSSSRRELYWTDDDDAGFPAAFRNLHPVAETARGVLVVTSPVKRRGRGWTGVDRPRAAL